MERQLKWEERRWGRVEGSRREGPGRRRRDGDVGKGCIYTPRGKGEKTKISLSFSNFTPIHLLSSPSPTVLFPFHHDIFGGDTTGSSTNHGSATEGGKKPEASKRGKAKGESKHPPPERTPKSNAYIRPKKSLKKEEGRGKEHNFPHLPYLRTKTPSQTSPPPPPPL